MRLGPSAGVGVAGMEKSDVVFGTVVPAVQAVVVQMGGFE